MNCAPISPNDLEGGRAIDRKLIGVIFGGRYLILFWLMPVLYRKFVSAINTMQSIYNRYLFMEGALYSIMQPY